ncbi:excinuclease ABC subunit UvrC [Candidatus Uhrbacteria bacterium]|nr:excinuclease ABC subunit UvrC [Candidatus Uhrbacteria bacterium]
MPIPKHVAIKEGKLPPAPGVYLMKDARGKILYIGKATSLRSRVSSYFVRPADDRIAAMVKKIRSVDYQKTPTAVEALVLEANLIKKFQPPYNVMEKDDKSFLYLTFTREPYPRPVLIRGHELARMPKRQFLKVFGPYRSAAAVEAALDILRKAFPWTTCQPATSLASDVARRKRPCFYRHLGLCPGVCTGEIAPAEYRKIIRGLMRFFDGKWVEVIRDTRSAMKKASVEERFEEAATLRNRLYQLQHIRDIAVLTRDDARLDASINIFGRIEGYDISNIGGKEAVGSMVVFVDGRPKKSEYRKFAVKTVRGSNDTAMMEEVLRRRFGRGEDMGGWPKPDLLLVDGGVGQINAAKRALQAAGLAIPIVGIAKGFDRKQDELVYDKADYELARLILAFKPMLQHLRDEAHRFAVSYHRKLRGEAFLPK